MITKNCGRQTILSAEVDFTFADIVSGTFAPALDIPAGAIVVSGAVVVKTAFNSGTSDVLSVGDVALNTRYLSNGNIHATGMVNLVPTGFRHTGGEIGVLWTAVGAAATAGAAKLIVNYVIEGRATETFG